MKKFLALLLIIFLTSNVTFASVDRLSQEYLQNTKHFTLTKPLAEMIAKRALKKALKKETGTNFDVKFEGYTTSSIIPMPGYTVETITSVKNGIRLFRKS